MRSQGIAHPHRTARSPVPFAVAGDTVAHTPADIPAYVNAVAKSVGGLWEGDSNYRAPFRVSHVANGVSGLARGQIIDAHLAAAQRAVSWPGRVRLALVSAQRRER